MGKANTKPTKLIGQFEDYTHYGEIVNKNHMKRYYLKQKSLNRSFYAWACPISNLDKLKPIIKWHQTQETKIGGVLLKYLGVEEQLPLMDKIDRKWYKMLKFETYDYDFELEIVLRVLK